MKCTHNRKKFITFMDFRGWPEKLFVCEDCGIAISDFITQEDNQNYIKSHSYVPSVTVTLENEMIEQVLSL